MPFFADFQKYSFIMKCSLGSYAGHPIFNKGIASLQGVE